MGGSKYAAMILGLPFHDLTGGFKGFRARVLDKAHVRPRVESGKRIRRLAMAHLWEERPA